MTDREKMFNEFYNLMMRMNYENGLCQEDRLKFDNLKKQLLGTNK